MQKEIINHQQEVLPLKKLRIALSLILSLCFIFAGCDLDIEDETISVSGDLAYYAEMDEDTLEEKCEGN